MSDSIDHICLNPISHSKKRCMEDRSDGFGAQFLTIIYAAAVCNQHKLDFVYKPIKRMEHNYDNDPDFLNKVDNLINFKDNYINYDNLSQVEKEEVVYISLWGAIELVKSNYDLYLGKENMKLIKKYFFENKNKNFYGNDYFNVAVHIRRKNCVDWRNEGSITPDSYYLGIINKIREKHSDKKLLFHIYSQGDINNFKDYLNNDTVLHVNENLFDSFIGLASADVLVMSCSDFSFSAAILSNSEEIYFLYESWYLHKPLSNWIINSP